MHPSVSRSLSATPVRFDRAANGLDNTRHCKSTLMGASVAGEPAKGLLMARILCVDDEPTVVNLKCKILEAAGHTVTAATSAHEAIDKLEAAAYDAVVTDWRLG